MTDPAAIEIVATSPSRFAPLFQFLRRHRAYVGLALSLIPFIAYKLRDLRLPYFWDELGVYARAAMHLHDHTLGLLPKHLPPELSRGHPPLLAFIWGGLFRIFGPTPLVAHVAMFLLALTLLVSVFHIARAHWGTAVGYAATFLFMVQPLFLAQSTLLLPELPLALCSLWTLHLFFRRRFLPGGICLALAIFVKETALVLGPVLGVMVVVDFVRRWPGLRRALAAFLALSLPAVLYGLFLLVQKKQNGWYFFPLHENHVNFAWAAMKGKLSDYVNFLFVEQGRFPATVIVGLWVVYRLFSSRPGEPRFRYSLAFSLGLLVAALVVFSPGNFFMKRYLLCLLAPLCMLCARALHELARDQARVLFPAAAVLMGFSLSTVAPAAFNYDYDMSFREVVRMQQEATAFVEKTIGVDQPILTMFPPIFGLEDPRFGYATRKFTRYSHLPNPEAKYAFVSEVFTRYTPPPGTRLELIKQFSSPYIHFYLCRILR